MSTIFLIISALCLGCGILFDLYMLIYAKIKGNLSAKFYCLTSFVCGATVVFFSLLSFLFKGITLLQFLLFIIGATVCFSLLVGIFWVMPKKLKHGVDISCQEEWLNLSYLLALSDRIKRFSLSEKESEFVQNFTQKIRRMTSYYCYELPSGVEISEFYRICSRVGVV